MHSYPKSLLAAMLLSGAGQAAFAVPFAVEGKLSQVNVNPGTLADPTVANTVVCNGTLVQLNGSTRFSSPSGPISAQKMVSNDRFPGRELVPPASPTDVNSKRSAFIGGTCIIDGEDTAAGRVAATMFVEPAENVLVGPTTNNPGEPFAIMGVPVRLLALTPEAGVVLAPEFVAEPGGRIIASPPLNGAGMKIKLNTVPKGDESSAEGYLSDDGKTFYAHVVETSGGELLEPQNYPTASIQRAEASFGNNSAKLEVRGGCTFLPATPRPLPIVVQVNKLGDWVNANGGANARAVSTTCVEDAATPGFGTYRFRNDNYAITPTTRPTRVRVAPSGPLPLNFSEVFTLTVR
ncbi:MAG: hypothetical protein JWR74_53 [Polaromonas sp.]|nr:hypothetical protein [Polaromonas sp.]